MINLRRYERKFRDVCACVLPCKCIVRKLNLRIKVRRRIDEWADEQTGNAVQRVKYNRDCNENKRKFTYVESNIARV